MTDVIVTRHAEKRMKERSGLNKKSVQRMANRAYARGYKVEDVSGGLRTWAFKTIYTKSIYDDLRFYGDKAYIFYGRALITLIQIPTDYTGWRSQEIERMCA